MNRSNRAKSLIFFCLITFLLLFTSIYLIDYSRAAPNGESLIIDNKSLQMEENSTFQGKIENTTSIEIELPSSEWNVMGIDLNFTNIEIERQIKIREDQVGSYDSIYFTVPSNYQKALYVQLDITEQTTIYGVFIYVKARQSIENITFQIRGYNIGSNAPNSTRFGPSKSLNISEVEGWYLQDFTSDPVELSIGTYSLVIDGTEKSYSPGQGYFLDWYHNGAYEPLIPNLHSGHFSNSGWNVNVNQTFLHELVQKSDKDIIPEEINMTAHFAGNLEEISGSSPREGMVFLECNELISDNLLNITISNNQSMILNYTVDFSISLQKITVLNSSITIRESLDNSWDIEFSVNKDDFHDYQIEIDYLIYEWKNITIYKETDNITSGEILNETNKIITLSNDTIGEGETNWRITAESPQINLNLDFPSVYLSTERGSHLRLTVINASSGNLTFIIIDSIGFEVYRSVAEIVSGNYIFDNYIIPNNALAGAWKIYVYWNNNSHAGVRTQQFTVLVPFTIDPQVIINTVLTIIILSIVSVSAYQTTKVVKKRYDDTKKRVLNMVSDILNLRYFIISEKDTSLNIYEKQIGKGKKDAILISGYLDALSKFEIALTGSEERSQSIKLEFQDSKILMSDFKNFRITVILKQNPSKYILNSIEKLSYDIDKQYGEFLANFTGDLRHFRGLDELIEKHLRISLINPYKIDYKKIENLNQKERIMIKRASDILKTSKHFFILFLIPENEWKYRNFKTILKLIEKNIFIAENMILKE